MKNELKQATVIKTGEKIEVYLLLGSSKNSGDYCDYTNDCKNIYKRNELKFK